MTVSPTARWGPVSEWQTPPPLLPFLMQCHRMPMGLVLSIAVAICRTAQARSQARASSVQVTAYRCDLY